MADLTLRDLNADLIGRLDAFAARHNLRRTQAAKFLLARVLLEEESRHAPVPPQQPAPLGRRRTT